MDQEQSDRQPAFNPTRRTALKAGASFLAGFLLPVGSPLTSAGVTATPNDIANAIQNLYTSLQLPHMHTPGINLIVDPQEYLQEMANSARTLLNLPESQIPSAMRRIAEETKEWTGNTLGMSHVGSNGLSTQMMRHSQKLAERLFKISPDCASGFRALQDSFAHMRTMLRQPSCKQDNSSKMDNTLQQHPDRVMETYDFQPQLSADTEQVFADINAVTGPEQATGREPFAERIFRKNQTILPQK